MDACSVAQLKRTGPVCKPQSLLEAVCCHPVQPLCGWRARMASIEVGTPRRDVHRGYFSLDVMWTGATSL